MPKKNNRNRKNTGWAKTKSYPHERHPATYRRKSAGSDDIEYITFTHSPAVELKGGKTERTVPMLDNVSPAERKKNKAEGKKFGENRSYGFYIPVTVVGRYASEAVIPKFIPPIMGIVIGMNIPKIVGIAYVKLP